MGDNDKLKDFSKSPTSVSDYLEVMFKKIEIVIV
jgi:hypothetical protein